VNRLARLLWGHEQLTDLGEAGVELALHPSDPEEPLERTDERAPVGQGAIGS